MNIDTDEARRIVGHAVLAIVPDADLSSLPEDADLRQTFELDSLDFLSFVEDVGQETGIRIEEDDYPELTTLAGCAGFLARRRSG